jgi:hypothetical protein
MPAPTTPRPRRRNSSAPWPRMRGSQALLRARAATRLNAVIVAIRPASRADAGSPPAKMITPSNDMPTTTTRSAASTATLYSTSHRDTGRETRACGRGGRTAFAAKLPLVTLGTETGDVPSNPVGSIPLSGPVGKTCGCPPSAGGAVIDAPLLLRVHESERVKTSGHPLGQSLVSVPGAITAGYRPAPRRRYRDFRSSSGAPRLLPSVLSDEVNHGPAVIDIPQ